MPSHTPDRTMGGDHRWTLHGKLREGKLYWNLINQRLKVIDGDLSTYPSFSIVDLEASSLGAY